MTHNKLNYLEIMHKNGCRITQQRQAILDAICQSGSHATAAEIYLRARDLNEGINRSTIYRSLDVFEKLGLVLSSKNAAGEQVYEIAKEQPHHHLVCRLCGKDTEINNRVVEEFYRSLQHEHGYTVGMDHLVVLGVCSSCAG